MFPSFIFSVICLYPFGLQVTYFNPRFIVQYYVYFLIQVLLALALRTLFVGFPLAYTHCFLFHFEHLLTLCLCKVLQIMQHIPGPCVNISHFSTVCWFLSCCCCCLVAKSCPTLCNPWTAACQILLSSLPPEDCPNSCPLSLTMSSSATLFSFCLQSFPASGYFPMSQLFTSGVKVQEHQHQSFQ